MKGAFNNEEAIGPLVVARQLHQDYVGKSRNTGREIQRERHARVFYHVGEMCDLPMHAVRCLIYCFYLVMVGKRIYFQGTTVSLL